MMALIWGLLDRLDHVRHFDQLRAVLQLFGCAVVRVLHERDPGFGIGARREQNCLRVGGFRFLRTD